MDAPKIESTSNAPQPESRQASGTIRKVALALERSIFTLGKHWLFAFNLFLAIYVGVPFLAPVFMRLGWPVPAWVIYTLYSPLCNQWAHHSWFVFGARSYYPSAVFQAYTGINPDTLEGILAARAFVGNALMGYKVAICERDVAIYGTMLLCGLVYGIPAARRRVGPLPWQAWFLIGIVPIGIDGFWQLFTTFPFTAVFPALNQLPHHESSPFWRSLTGGLFGLANIWLAYPHFEASMREAHAELKVRLAHVDSEAPQPRLKP